MKMIRSLAGLAAAAAVMAVPTAARAAAQLQFYYDNVLALTCVDDTGCDSSPGAPGNLTFVGAIGVFSVNVATGVSKPVSNAPQLMDLNSVQVRAVGGAPHTLEVRFSDNDFTGLGRISGHWGGTVTSGTVSAGAYYDTGNVLGALTTSLGSMGPFTSSGGTAVFAGQLAATPVMSAPYSVTQWVKVESGRNQATSVSGDFSLDIPEPASIALVGLSLLGLGVASRRRRKA